MNYYFYGGHCCVCTDVCWHGGSSYYCDAHNPNQTYKQPTHITTTNWFCTDCGELKKENEKLQKHVDSLMEVIQMWLELWLEKEKENE